MSIGGGVASDSWSGEATVSSVTILPIGECSDLPLDMPAIAWISRSLTSIAMLTLGCREVLGELVTKMVRVPSASEAVHSDSTRGGGGISILMSGCSLVVTLAQLLNDSSKVVVMGSLSPFKPAGYTTCGLVDRSWCTLSWLISP